MESGFLLAGTGREIQTASADVRGTKIHSGDILVSRGGAPTSALIARGNDYPGNFSHIALVYVDPVTNEAKIVESHIEIGVVVSTAEEYLKDKKLRVMLLRPRADLSQIVKDPMLPHKAAEFAYRRAKEGNFRMILKWTIKIMQNSSARKWRRVHMSNSTFICGPASLMSLPLD